MFMVAGYVFYRKLRLKYVFILGVAAFVVLLVSHICRIPFCPMQGHKFPPDFLFLTYGILALAVLSILFSKVTLPSWHILRLWNEHGFSIYLYQNIPYTAVALALRHGLLTSSSWTQMLLSIASVFTISTTTFLIWGYLKTKFMSSTTDISANQSRDMHDR